MPDASLGAYQLGPELGRGGMGVVYRGRHMNPAFARDQGGDVAIKVLHSHLTEDPAIRLRFENEAGVGRRLNHKHIVRVLDLVVDGGRLGIVMELVDGTPLHHLIDTRRVTVQQAEAWTDQLCSALGHAHGQGVIHRDIKPENILIDQDQRVRLGDFGIAKDLRMKLTRGDARMGTLAYMPPEQFHQAALVDGRADTYAVAMTLLEMLTFELPWPDNANDFDILERKEQNRLELGDLSNMPAGLEPALRTALEADPDDRFHTIGAFRVAVRRAFGTLEQASTLKHDVVPPRPEPTPLPPPTPPAETAVPEETEVNERLTGQEQQVLAIALVQLVGGIGQLALAIGLLLKALMGVPTGGAMIVAGGLGLYSVIRIWAANGLRSFQPAARKALIGLAIPGLLTFPPFAVWALFGLGSKAGAEAFSQPQAELRALADRPPTAPGWTWALVVLQLLMFLAVGVALLS